MLKQPLQSFFFFWGGGGGVGGRGKWYQTTGAQVKLMVCDKHDTERMNMVCRVQVRDLFKGVYSNGYSITFT